MQRILIACAFLAARCATADEMAVKVEPVRPTGKMQLFSGLDNPKNKSVKKQGESSEKPDGEWNAVDIVVKGNTISSSVNGVLQNVGKDAYADAGQICLQSEGGPIEFRNVYIEPLP